MKLENSLKGRYIDQGQVTILTVLTLFTLFFLNPYVKGLNAQEVKSEDAKMQKKLFFLAESGFMFVKSEHVEGENNYGSYVPVRLGILYQFIPQFDIYIAAGAGINLSGDPWKTFLMPTVAFTMHFGPALIGIGVSYNNQLKKTGEKTTFYHPIFLGYEMLHKSHRQGSIFLEFHAPMRWWIGEGRGVSRWNKFNLGFRFLF
jgi:hypothetical protein